MSKSVSFPSHVNSKRGRGRPRKSNEASPESLSGKGPVPIKRPGPTPKAKPMTSKSIPDSVVVDTPSDAAISSSNINNNIAINVKKGGMPRTTSGTITNQDTITGTKKDAITKEDSISNKEKTIATCTKNNSLMVANIESATVDTDNIQKDIENVHSDTGALMHNVLETPGPDTVRANQQDDNVRDVSEPAVRDGGAARSPSSASKPKHRGFDLSKKIDVSASSQALIDSEKKLFKCEVCGESMLNWQTLEEHRARAGHYKCMVPDCNYGDCSADDVVAHLSKDHGDLSTYLITDKPAVNSGMPNVKDVINFIVKASSPKTFFPVQVPQRKPSGAQERATLPSNSRVHTPPQRQVVEQRDFKTVTPPLTPAAAKCNSETVLVSDKTLRGQPVAVTKISTRSGSAFGISPKQEQPSGRNIRPMDTVVKGTMVPQKGGLVPVIRAGKRLAESPQAARRGPLPAKQRFVTSTLISFGKASPGGNRRTKTTVNILSKRGITVTSTSRSPTESQPARSQPKQTPAVPTLHLGPSVSITPTVTNNIRPQNQGSLLVEFVRSSPPQPTSFEQRPTIDLTVEDGESWTPVSPSPWSNPPPAKNSSPAARPRETPGKSECHVCDKVFSNPGALALHMMSHVDNSVGKELNYKCSICSSQYATSANLTRHLNTYHNDHTGGRARESNPQPAPSSGSEQELVIPLVDLRQIGGPAGLKALGGIHHYIRLRNLEIHPSRIVSIDTACKND